MIRKLNSSQYFLLSLAILLQVIYFSACEFPSPDKALPSDSTISYKDSIAPYIDSTKAQLYFDTALVLRQSKNYRTSTSYFDLALRSKFQPTHEIYYLIGNNFFDAKNYETAIFYYNEAIIFNPKKNPMYFHDRALTAYYLGLSASTVCSDVDSAIAYGDTTNIAVLCEEAKDRYSN